MKRWQAGLVGLSLFTSSCAESIESQKSEQTPIQAQIELLEEMPGDSIAERLAALDAVIVFCGGQLELSPRLALNVEQEIDYLSMQETMKHVSKSALGAFCAQVVFVVE